MSGCACWQSPVDKASALRLRRVGVAREYLGGSVPAQTYTKRSITGLSFGTQRKSRRTRACTLTCISEQEAQRTCARAVSNEDMLDAGTLHVLQLVACKLLELVRLNRTKQRDCLHARPAPRCSAWWERIGQTASRSGGQWQFDRQLFEGRERGVQCASECTRDQMTSAIRQSVLRASYLEHGVDCALRGQFLATSGG